MEKKQRGNAVARSFQSRLSFLSVKGRGKKKEGNTALRDHVLSVCCGSVCAVWHFGALRSRQHASVSHCADRDADCSRPEYLRSSCGNARCWGRAKRCNSVIRHNNPHQEEAHGHRLLRSGKYDGGTPVGSCRPEVCDRLGATPTGRFHSHPAPSQRNHFCKS